jgi:hypothetical protein
MVRPTGYLAAGTVLLVACGDDAGLPDARVIDGSPPGGTLSLTWTLADGETPVTCDQVGAATVTLSIIPVGQPFGVTEAFGCTSAQGTTRVIAAGRHDVTATLGGGGAIAPAVLRLGVEVRSNEVTAVEAIAFDVDATGALERWRVCSDDVRDRSRGDTAGGDVYRRLRRARTRELHRRGPGHRRHRRGVGPVSAGRRGARGRYRVLGREPRCADSSGWGRGFHRHGESAPLQRERMRGTLNHLVERGGFGPT